MHLGIAREKAGRIENEISVASRDAGKVLDTVYMLPSLDVGMKSRLRL